jgi:hypothetical protein
VRKLEARKATAEHADYAEGGHKLWQAIEGRGLTDGRQSGRQSVRKAKFEASVRLFSSIRQNRPIKLLRRICRVRVCERKR